jgi:NAD(P)-dependent dehydrogenase (short-subunit alcohol dehydrogenase family)
MELKGKVALITGGASGIGLATARRLAEEGMRVCVVDVDHDAARAAAKAVDGLAVAADVSDPDQVDAAFLQCVEKFGGLDLAHLNAGVSRAWSGDMAELELADYRRWIGVNFDGVAFGARAAVRALRQGAPGTPHKALIATSSISGLDPFYPDPIYAAGKHAVVGLMRSMAPNLAAEGISCQVICPGLTDTGMLPAAGKKALDKAGIPVATPEEIADAVLLAAKSPLETAGTCWVCHPAQPPFPFEFNSAPGPHSVVNVHR